MERLVLAWLSVLDVLPDYRRSYITELILNACVYDLHVFMIFSIFLANVCLSTITVYCNPNYSLNVYTSFFTANVMADSFPSLKELYEYMIPDHAVKWRTVGEMLGLPTGELDIIENDNHYKAVPCCQAMLRKWLDIYPNATMRKLCDAVRSPVVVALNNDNSNITCKYHTYVNVLSEVPEIVFLCVLHLPTLHTHISQYTIHHYIK